MKIEVIGTGMVGKTLAAMLNAKGERVLVANSRRPADVAGVVGSLCARRHPWAERP